MTVLFSLDGKRTKKYEKASRMKSIHQVVYQDTWLVDAIVLLAIALMMIIINCADPSSALANMNVIMRMILMLSFIAFIHNLFKFIYPAGTQRPAAPCPPKTPGKRRRR